MGRIVKLLVVIAVLVFIWKVVVPKFVQQVDDGDEAAESGEASCVRGAEQASETWGSGLRQFVNPPYDLEAWSSFRGEVDLQIDAAEGACGCEEPSCEKAGSALRDLRALVSEMDTSIRNTSSPPEDLVSRQAGIDDRITQAGELVKSGK